MTISTTVRKDVERVRAKLIRQAKREGLRENFGQRDWRKLNDQYFGLAYGDPDERAAYALVADLHDWCTTYTGRETRA